MMINDNNMILDYNSQYDLQSVGPLSTDRRGQVFDFHGFDVFFSRVFIQDADITTSSSLPWLCILYRHDW